MTGDPLDSQREVLVAALNDARPSPDWAWEVLNTWDSLVEVARAARALQETEWIAFIGWQPSSDREQAISSSCAVLTEALARLDGPR